MPYVRYRTLRAKSENIARSVGYLTESGRFRGDPAFAVQPHRILDPETECAEMKKLRNVLAAALLTIPVLALNASTLADYTDEVVVRPTPSVTACCWVYFMGRWMCIPC